MRTIKFRGKRVDNGEWMYGDLTTYDNDCVICDNDDGGYLPIVRETVGQFTGLYDGTKWEDLSEEEKQDFYFQNRSDDGVTIKYKTKEEVKHLWKGKEIYEGDIVSTEKRDVSFEIVWVQENSSFMFKSNDSLNLWEIDKSVQRLEVIGNIHDNKEIK